MLIDLAKRLTGKADAILVPMPFPVPVVGVYFLLCGEDVVYVGQSVDVGQRIASHRTERAKVFDRAFYVACNEDELDGLESKFVNELRPKYNRSGYTSGRGLEVGRAVTARDAAVGLLAEAGGDPIRADDLYRRVSGPRYVSRQMFYRYLDADPRVAWNWRDCSYRFVRP